jgi:hypothetical protein
VPENNDGIPDYAELNYLSCEEVEGRLAEEAAQKSLAEGGDCDFPETAQIKKIRKKQVDAIISEAEMLAVLSLARKKNNDCYVDFLMGEDTYSYHYFRELFYSGNAREDICGKKRSDITGSMPTVEGLYNNSNEYKIRMEALLLRIGLPLVLGGPRGYDFHHRIPKRYNEPKTGVKINDQREVDFDYHAPANIRIVPYAVHRQISIIWKKFDEENPTATWDEINAFADQLDQEFGQYYLYKFLY